VTKTKSCLKIFQLSLSEAQGKPTSFFDRHFQELNRQPEPEPETRGQQLRRFTDTPEPVQRISSQTYDR
jgi:hypothetical protein